MILKTKQLSKSFGGLKAINKVDFELPKNEIRGIIGPNGSGKSTFFNLVSGIYDSDPGSYIEFDGHDITFTPPHEIASYGLSRTFQLLRLYQDMTVIDNVMSGYHTRVPYKFFDAVIGRKKIWDQERAIKEEMMELLSFVGLADYAELNASELSGGQRRRVEIARSLLHRPKLLLLDEPTVGLDIGSRQMILKHVKALCKKGDLAVLWATHLIDEIDKGEKVVIIHNGKILESGDVSKVIKKTKQKTCFW